MIDCHVHMDDDRYDNTRDQIIKDFGKDGIDFIINSASSYNTMNASYELAKKYDNVYTTIGLHPACVDDCKPKTWARMDELADYEKTVAVGEIGLDYHYPGYDKERQMDVFAAQIEFADAHKLPIILHIREAWGDCVDLLKAEKKYLNNGVMFHCYNGSEELTRAFAAQGYYFSFGGSLTYMKQKRFAMLSAVPIGQVVTETDGPYLTPEPYRGQMNSPKYIRYVLPLLADNFGLTVSQMEDQIEYNARKFFKKLK